MENPHDRFAGIALFVTSIAMLLIVFFFPGIFIDEEAQERYAEKKLFCEQYSTVTKSNLPVKCYDWYGIR